MIDPELAQQLRQAGLIWSPAKRDNFMIPGGDLARDVFSLNDQTILIHNVNGEYAVTFHGSVEWALDHVMLVDVVWLPTETQLREQLQRRLGDRATVTLQASGHMYKCLIYADGEQTFTGATAEQAYGNALLYLLQHAESDQGPQWVEAA